jgi:hypothetical protein
MSIYTERVMREQGVTVTHQQAAAVAADLAIALERCRNTTLAPVGRVGWLADHDGSLMPARPLLAGFDLALDLVREWVLAHRETPNEGGTD